MPNLMLSDTQIGNLVAYILSLQMPRAQVVDEMPVG